MVAEAARLDRGTYRTGSNADFFNTIRRFRSFESALGMQQMDPLLNRVGFAERQTPNVSPGDIRFALRLQKREADFQALFDARLNGGRGSQRARRAVVNSRACNRIECRVATRSLDLAANPATFVDATGKAQPLQPLAHDDDFIERGGCRLKEKQRKDQHQKRTGTPMRMWLIELSRWRKSRRRSTRRLTRYWKPTPIVKLLRHSCASATSAVPPSR